MRARGVGSGTSVKPVKVSKVEHDAKPVHHCETYFEVFGKKISANLILTVNRKSDVLRQQYTSYQILVEEARYQDQLS